MYNTLFISNTLVVTLFSIKILFFLIFLQVVPNAMESMESSNALGGVWVNFYREVSHNRWSLEDKPFFVLFSDIVGPLAAPALLAAGSRFYYVL